ncbi:hypothetical protein V9T40_001389 [Parthenolecanium corni]|uniref:Uncharacterized protein n=1 Tax=Parthenolecanium corni TaxID=536013 RepID=A0AAN9TDE4_9HEMI
MINGEPEPELATQPFGMGEEVTAWPWLQGRRIKTDRLIGSVTTTANLTGEDEASEFHDLLALAIRI